MDTVGPASAVQPAAATPPAARTPAAASVTTRAMFVAEVSAQLALVAHEMRTPLAIAVSAAETLRRAITADDADPAELIRMAGIVHRYSLLAARLVDRRGLAHDILHGTVLLELEAIDLLELTDGLVADVAAFVLPARTVTVAGGDPVPAIADAAAISEILFNLLVNAAKYSPKGTPIEVLVEVVPGGVRLVVRDHGDGIARGDVDGLFDAYTQADDTTSGSGLGLFVARGLARAHAGELAVRAAPAGGSEFVLDLPTGPS